MTPDEITAIRALRVCTFPVASPDKRFVRDFKNREDAELTPRQRDYLFRLLYRYRRQHGVPCDKPEPEAGH